MTDRRIVCIERAYEGRGHITGVGTGSDPKKAETHWTVAEVTKAIKEGHTFHTVGADGKKAYIEPWTVQTLRTKADLSKADNLDSMRACNFQ